MNATWLERELVCAPLFIGLCTSDAMFRNELRRLKVPRAQWPGGFMPTRSANACVHFLENPDGEVIAMVCINAGKRPLIQCYALLVHEAMHVWREIRTMLGEKFPSSEFEAYSMQRISQSLFAAFDKQMKVKHGRR